ncbi:Predicted acyl-CoA transferases/carnitine dehydratase [Mycobacteroides abscessus subsp. massiliense]|nr:Predicted acyl-CoA transferases/carnitine dehydratase [Mycobacteroides abscessus subsp. massiliense]SLD46026.1 Predicted acyl-CoA transferases/carnitine dehydratase [Mycobacteroides abscessus subsp. massiliense]
MLPLTGVNVVSLAINLPGPAACARLAEFGAAVTKVEPPGGDPLAPAKARVPRSPARPSPNSKPLRPRLISP